MGDVIVIAEIGENHIGNLKIAKSLIKKAAEAKADYVKFQSYGPENFSVSDFEYNWFKKVALSDRAHFILKEYAEKCGIKFLSSPFSIKSSKFICRDLGLKTIKIASAVMLNFGVLDYINSAGVDTVFLSTGMANLDEVSLSLKHLAKIPNVYIMHCVVQYPCIDQEANLRAVITLQNKFDFPVGYSDHTIGIDACIIAAALGASVIEKHLTFDKNYPEGTDHILSASPLEFKEMVNKIHKIKLLLGSGIKEPSAGERKVIKFIRNRFK